MSVVGSRSRSFRYVTNCTNAIGSDIDNMVNSGVRITRRTFLGYVEPSGMKILERALGYDHRLPMSRDWHVSYYKGTFRGKPAVWFDHSRIEYIFCAP